jgi:hypothetical protein
VKFRVLYRPEKPATNAASMLRDEKGVEQLK